MDSVASWVIDAFNANAYQETSLGITLKDGTSLTVDNEDIVSGSMSIDRYSVNNGVIVLGTVVAAEFKVTLNNHDGRFDAYDFAGAKIDARSVVRYNGQVTSLRLGTFYVQGSPRRLSTIAITALDEVTKLDIPIDRSRFTVIKSVTNFIQSLCYNTPVYYGYLTQTASGRPNSSGAIAPLPMTSEVLTARQVLGWLAALLGAFVYAGSDGYLRFGWYDTGSSSGSTYTADYTSTEANRYSSDVYDDPIEFTGIFFKDESDKQEYLVGTGDYAIDLTGNLLLPLWRRSGSDPLSASRIEEAMQSLYNGIIPLEYYMYSMRMKPAPYLWPGDSIDFVTGSGNTAVHRLTTITHTQYTLNGANVVEATGETPEEHPIMPSSSGAVALPTLKTSDIAATGNISATGNIAATGDVTVGGNLTVSSNGLLKVMTNTTTVSVSAGSPNQTGTITFSPGTEWTIVGVVGFSTSGNLMVVRKVDHPYGTTQVQMDVRYSGSSSSSQSVTLSATVLCLRTG